MQAPHETQTNAIIVSCDIVGHGAETDLSEQVRRVSELNHCVKATCGPHLATGAVWASGGDGGHVAFLDLALAEASIELIKELFQWANYTTGITNTEQLPLRLSMHFGPVCVIEGADGRRQLVGDGINIAGNLVAIAPPGGVLVTSDLARYIISINKWENALFTKVEFLQQRHIYLKHSRKITTSLLHIPSIIDATRVDNQRSDRALLDAAKRKGDAWETLYYAKRLLQVDSTDADAIGAMSSADPTRMSVEQSRAGEYRAHPLFSQFNRQSLQQFIRASYLIERKDGEIICSQGDTGDAMFIPVQGQIRVVLEDYKSEDGQEADDHPADIILDKGHVVGELALALGAKRTATLQAVGNCALLAINYQAMQSLLDMKPVNMRLQRSFKEFLLSRTLEHVCRTAPYLALEDGSPFGQVEEPWEVLADDAELLHIDWEQADCISATDEAFAHPGLYILVAGAVIERSQSANVPKNLHSKDLPIVFANFPGDLVTPYHEFQVDSRLDHSGISIIKVGDRAFKSLGPRLFADVLDGLRRQISSQFVFDAFISYTRNDAHVAHSWLEAMEKAGLRVYMSKPEAMSRFKPEIELALVESLVMVPFISNQAKGDGVRDSWVEREINFRKTLFDGDHCNILPVQLSPRVTEHFADGFSSITVSGDGEAAVAEAISTIKSVRIGTTSPPFARKLLITRTL